MDPDSVLITILKSKSVKRKKLVDILNKGADVNKAYDVIFGEKDYKKGQNCFSLYKRIKDLGGKYLLNLGPDKDGELDSMEVKSLLELGKLL